jgi:protoheme IX farnesyltransferase
VATATAQNAVIRPLHAYFSLARLKAVLPHLVTAAAAMFLAAGGLPPVSTLLFTLLGGGCLAAAANTFNSYLDRDIDALMVRTSRRPLPSGRVGPGQALVFGAGVGLAGIAVLSGLVDRAAALLAVLALLYYVLPYTLWLKRRTYWGAIIGSTIGAFPPLIGWTVITHRIEAAPFLLAAIIILWTLPHFWTLAIYRRHDYARAGLSILPQKGVLAGISAGSLLMVAVSLILAPVAGLGLFYTGVASVTGSVFLYLALRLDRGDAWRAAGRLHSYSIFYIAVLFGAMIIDRAAGL